MLMMLMKIVSTWSCKKNQLQAGAHNVAIIAPKEDMRVIMIIPAHVPIKTPPNNHDKPKNAPIAVATPLPPLKLKNIGQMCPNNAANITLPITHGAKPNCVTNIVGIKPLQPSPNMVMMAGAFPPRRSTFVAPGFLEPWLRGSGKPQSLQTMMALDNEPIK